MNKIKFFEVRIDPMYDIDWDNESAYPKFHGEVKTDHWIPSVKCCNGSMGNGILPYKIEFSISEILNVGRGTKLEIHEYQDLKRKMLDKYGADPEIFYLYPGIAFSPIKYVPPTDPSLDWLTPFFQGMNIINRRTAGLLGSSFDRFIKLERLDGCSYFVLVPRLVPIYNFRCHSVQPCSRCGRVWVRRDNHHPVIDPAVADLNWPIFKIPQHSSTYVNQSFKEMLEDFGVLGIVFDAVDTE